MKVSLPLEQFSHHLQQEPTPHQPSVAETTMLPPQHALLATHVVPDPAFAAKIQSHGAQIPLCYFCLLSGFSSDDVKYVWQIHSPYHISCTSPLSVRQQTFLSAASLFIEVSDPSVLPENLASITSALPFL